MIITQDANRVQRSLIRTYSAANATPGTGLAEAIKTAFAATAATALLRNAGSSGVIRPKYLRMINTVVPASGTRTEGRIALDKGATRWSSGGTALTAKGRDMTSNVASAATVRFGALVTAAATADVRYVSRFQLSTVIAVVFEEWLITFGDSAQAAGTLGGTVSRRVVQDVGPIVLGPSQEMIIHTWTPDNAVTPPSWEVEMCWEESKK